ncbi:hypothetical protein, partial [uncultured Hymenobacter sp.]|uniref:hypothetical protein n=1 Tax=uncultured Hymenobacter sp. TaxID=170016 RepID=UPI0035CC55EF
MTRPLATSQAIKRPWALRAEPACVIEGTRAEFGQPDGATTPAKLEITARYVAPRWYCLELGAGLEEWHKSGIELFDLQVF